GDVRRTAALQACEQGPGAPVVDEGLDSLRLDAFREALVPAPAPIAGVVVESGVSADRDQGGDSLRSAGGDMKREPAAHRVTHEVRSPDVQLFPKRDQVFG